MSAGSEKVMDTRLPSSAPSVPPVATRVETAPVQSAIKPDLAPPIAVAAQAGAEMARWNRDSKRSELPAQPKRSESSVETDRETGDLIYKIVDPETRATIAQYPYEGILRLRAYIKSATS